tara:strand:+ start:160 stop:720 length:561 start_codon:yes stop_codon:yes gene_type:complete
MAKSPFKMKGFSGFGNSPAKFIYGKKTKTENKDGTYTTHSTNLLTGRKKAVTETTGEGDFGGIETTKTVQKTSKSGGKAKVKTTSVEQTPAWSSKNKLFKTKTKTKLSNRKGEDDYKITSQKQKTKITGSKYKSKKVNTAGSISGVDDNFQDPRINQETGEWKQKIQYPSSYKKAKKKQKLYGTGK